MRKILCLFNLFLIFIVVFLFFNIDNYDSYLAFDDNNAAKLNVFCPATVLEDEEFYCNIGIKDVTNYIRGVELNYQISDGISFLSFENDDMWTTEGTGNTTTVLINDDGATNSIDLGKLVLKSTSDAVSNNSYTITITAKVVYKDDLDNYISLSPVEASFFNTSIKNIISYVKVNDYSLEINDGVKEYNVDLNNNITSAKIEIGLNNELSDLNLDEEKNIINLSDLRLGANQEYISVFSNDIEIFKLKLNIFRDSGKMGDIVENPKTGMGATFVIFLVLIVSIFVLLVNFNKVSRGDQ